MTEEKKARIAFVGVGGMGQCAHLVNYSYLGQCDVVALAELKEKQGKLVAARYGVPKVYTDIAEMMEKEDVDGIVASQPFNRHGVLVPQLAKYGKPIFTEKPLAASVQVGEQIVKSLEENNCKHMVGYHKRSDPASEYAKAEIDRLKETGELGKMRYVRVLMPAGDWIAGGFNVMLSTDEAMPADVDWDPAPEDMDEGTFGMYGGFVNYYIHQVNLMRYFLGEPYKVTYADPSGVMLAGQSESGIACVIEMTPYQTSVDWQESAMVCFEKGYIKVELPAPLAYNRPGRVEMYRDPGGKTPETVVPQLPWLHAMAKQAVNFIEFVRGNAPAPCEAPEALEDLKVAREYIRLLCGK